MKLVFTILFTLGFIYLIYCVIINRKVRVTSYRCKSERLPAGFEGFKIVLLTDIHNEAYLNKESFVKQVVSLKPDIILLGGDLIDSRRTNIEEALSLITKLKQDIPLYYVTGNHEFRIQEYPLFEDKLKECGVEVLRNRNVMLHKNKDTIQLVGIDDPHFMSKQGHTNEQIKVNQLLDGYHFNIYSILLSHRPEFFIDFSSHEIDLVLSGHTHGGQIRIPFVGGIIAPHQGFFPRYDAGLFVSGLTTMIISKGLGRSSFPLRINNQPEIVEVTLTRTK